MRLIALSPASPDPRGIIPRFLSLNLGISAYLTPPVYQGAWSLVVGALLAEVEAASLERAIGRTEVWLTEAG